MAKGELKYLAQHDQRKHDRVKRALGFLEHDPKHKSLQVHPFQSKKGPKGEKVWTAYAEQKTPAAYRIFFHYLPNYTIFIVAITPHQEDKVFR